MRSEDDERLKKAALKKLLDYSIDEMDNTANSNNRTSGCLNLIFGNNSFVSFRELDCSFDNRTDTAFHSTPLNSKYNERPFPDSQYIKSLKLTDSDFLDSEAGKQLIFNDQALHESHNLQKTTCAGCSSWTPCSRKNMSSIPIPISGYKQEKSISVGEFIGKFSESMSFCSSQNKQNIFANCFTSTPKEKRKSFSMSSLLDIQSNDFSNKTLSSPDNTREESVVTILTPTSIKPLNLETPNWKEKTLEDFHCFIGDTARKNVERLRKEEKYIRELDGSATFYSQKTDKTETSCSGATGCNSTTLELQRDKYALKNDSSSKICNDQWYLDPRIVLLEAKKGKNVRLINKSPKILKFKTEFNSRFITVCPLSGTIPAKNQIGLRIYISQYAKKQNASFEEEIKVVIGKTENSISVKFVRVEKSKLLKKRSYILY